MGKTYKNGRLRFRQLTGNTKIQERKNKRQELIKYFFAILSLVTGTVLIYFIEHWLLISVIGILTLITINQCESKRNYLTFKKNGVSDYLWFGPFWLLCWISEGFTTQDTGYKN